MPEKESNGRTDPANLPGDGWREVRERDVEGRPVMAGYAAPAGRRVPVSVPA